MAINETIISSSYSTMMSQLGNALKNSGLFTKVTFDTYNIHCYIDSNEVLSFWTGGWSNATTIRAYSTNKNSYICGDGGSGRAFNKMMTTSKGVVLGTNDVYYAFIGKTIDKNGNVSAGIVASDPTSILTGEKIQMYGFSSTNIDKAGTYTINRVKTDITVLQNAFTDGGSEFFESIYLVSACENANVGKVKIGDTIGYSNGYIFIPE